MAAPRSPSTTPLPFFSYPYQRVRAKEIQDELLARLSSEDRDRTYPNVNPYGPRRPPTDIMESSLTAKLSAEIKNKYEEFSKKISKKETAPNKSSLQQFIQEMQILMSQYDAKYSCMKSMEFALKRAEQQLDKSVDLQIYRAEIPKRVWDRDFAPQKNFVYYHGRVALSALITGYAIVAATVVGAAALLLSEGPDAPTLDLSGGGKSETGGLANASRKAYTLKREIPSQYVKHKVSLDDVNDLRRELAKDRIDDPVTIFFMEAAKDELTDRTLLQGTQHMLSERKQKNPHGHVLYFESFADAFLYRDYYYANEESESAKYDPMAGWRMREKWKADELASVHKRYATEVKAPPAAMQSHAAAARALAAQPPVAKAPATAVQASAAKTAPVTPTPPVAAKAPATSAQSAAVKASTAPPPANAAKENAKGATATTGTTPAAGRLGIDVFWVEQHSRAQNAATTETSKAPPPPRGRQRPKGTS